MKKRTLYIIGIAIIVACIIALDYMDKQAYKQCIKLHNDYDYCNNIIQASKH